MLTLRLPVLFIEHTQYKIIKLHSKQGAWSQLLKAGGLFECGHVGTVTSMLEVTHGQVLGLGCLGKEVGVLRRGSESGGLGDMEGFAKDSVLVLMRSG